MTRIAASEIAIRPPLISIKQCSGTLSNAAPGINIRVTALPTIGSTNESVIPNAIQFTRVSGRKAMPPVRRT